MNRLSRCTLAFLLLVAAACGREKPVPASLPPVILISVDTLRADHLPAYGYRSVRTPHLDAFAKQAIVFENAYSHVPLTLPSHVSLLTGTLPSANGVRNNLGYRFDAAAHPTIPSLLKTRGYVTGAAVSAYVLRASTGLGPAFDEYDDAMDKAAGASVGELERAGPRTLAAAKAWIERQPAGQPFFYMLHLFEPHAPYAPPEPFRTEYAGREYDGEIAAADSLVGEFLDFLRQKGIYDKALIVFLSDHGEGLGDHGESQHGIFLYREAIHVPLLVKLPDGHRGGERVAAPVQLVDVLPTVAAIAGLEVPADATGTSLLKIADGGSAERSIFSETMYPRIHLGLSDLASLVNAKHQYIEAPRAELYDLVADPAEKTNVLADERRVTAAMRTEMKRYDRTLAAPSAISAEEAAKLSALGYLSSTPSPASGELADPKDHIADLETAARAEQLTQEGRVGEAIALLQELVKRNPRFADAWSQLGDALSRAGRVEESIAAWRKTIEIAPMLASDGAISLAESYLAMQKFDDSIEHAKLALGTHPGAAHMLLARAYLAKGDLGAAEAEAGSLETDPLRRVDAAVLLAQIRVAQRRLDEAGRLLAGARQSAAGRPIPSLAFAEGDLAARLGRIAEAKRAFAAEIESFPGNREAWVRLAVLQALDGDLRAADATFERMLRALPGPATRAVAADTFEKLGQPGLAARWRARQRGAG
jgi:choline-sulfatase